MKTREHATSRTVTEPCLIRIG